MNKKSPFVILLMLVICGICYCWFQEEGEVQAAEAPQRLVRIDLLKGEKATLPPPSRNIFSRRLTTSGTQDLNVANPQSGSAQPQTEAGADAGATAVEQAAVAAVDLKYIGYILSGEEVVGLVVYAGETTAVEKGDWIDDRFRVNSISREEISILGPDTKEKIFSLEGDQL